MYHAASVSNTPHHLPFNHYPEILHEVSQGIDILEDSNPTLAQHDSIRNILNYSWDLLTSDEQQTFAKLSVFAGGFTRDAAQAIANANLRIMMNLINYSMLWRHNATGRYTLHSLLRHYAQDKLNEIQLEQQIKSLHSAHYLTHLAKLEVDLRGEHQVEALDVLETEFENIRVAWQWAVEHNNAEYIGMATEALNFFCDMRSYALIGLELFKSAYEKFIESDDANIRFIGGRCLSRWVRMNIVSMRKMDNNHRLSIFKSFAIAQQQQDLQELAFCYWLRGIINDALGGEIAETVVMFETSLELFTETDDAFYQADIMGWLGTWKGYMNPDEGRKYTQRCLEIQQTIKNPNGIAWGLLNQAYSNWNERNYTASTDFATQCLDSMRHIRHNKGILDIQRLIGHQYILRGEFDKAQKVLDEAYQLSVTLISGNHQIELLIQLALLESLQSNDYDNAQSLLHNAQQLTEQLHAFSWFYIEAVQVVIAIGRKAYSSLPHLITPLFKNPHYIPTLSLQYLPICLSSSMKNNMVTVPKYIVA